ncbi:MAG: hypothetical protein IPH75_10345 [bacterium]|nr:hypothetical protein [bacterium]
MTNSTSSSRMSKGTSWISILLVALLAYACAPGYAVGRGTSTSVGVSASYGELNEWGGWTVHAQFGEVWYPYVNSGWVPFTYGNWVWTDRGWLWSSYEPYGWLVYHYGNWYYDPAIGWFWVPGNSWSPATVVWYEYDNYVCWAPRPPSGYSWSRPWETSVTTTWTMVTKANFLQENVGRHKMSVRAPSRSGVSSFRRSAPSITVISKARGGNGDIKKVSVKRQKTTIQQKTYYRTDLPSVEKNKASRYQAQYKKGPKQQQPMRASGDKSGKSKKQDDKENKRRGEGGGKKR